MGTKERVEILNEKYMTQEEFNDIWKNAKVRITRNEEKNIMNDLLKRISDLEFEVEKLEKNEQYKYINGQAYFRQDYVLCREKEINRLNNIIDELEKYLEKTIADSKAGFSQYYDYLEILKYLQELKGSDKE